MREKIIKMRFVIYLFLAVGLLGVGCNKDCRNIPGGYTFEIPVSINPIQDTIRVGDTLRIESIFSELVFERKTGKTFELRNWDFFPITTVTRIDTTPAFRGALKDFRVLIDSAYNYQPFESSGDFFAYTGSYRNTDGQYELKFQIIPLASGLFCFAQGSWLEDFGSDQSFSGKCNGIRAEAVVLHGSSDQMNIEFLAESPDPQYNDWMLLRPQERFHDTGGYCFYVVE